MSAAQPPVILTQSDLRDLSSAKTLLESPSLTARLATVLGAPIEKGFAMLPANWSTTVHTAVQGALLRAVELAVCVKSILTHTVPPTINLEKTDPQCDLDFVPNQAREVRVKAALSNSFGFGGHNATLVLKAVT